MSPLNKPTIFPSSSNASIVIKKHNTSLRIFIQILHKEYSYIFYIKEKNYFL